MALSLASASYGFAPGFATFNPVQSAAMTIAQIQSVGIDKRALRETVQELSPLRMIQKKVQRVQEHICMAAGAADAAPKRSGFPDGEGEPPKRVGDFGFDPLNMGTPDNFAFMREAEIKHGRIAMMAAVAWPLQEILHPIIVDLLYDTMGITVPDVLIESGGASPSLLNGGLFQPEVLPSVALFFLGASLLEESDVAARKANGCAWNEYSESFGTFGRQPGNFGFDPLNFYKPLSPSDKVEVQERELLNGRVAMLAVASYVGTEFFGGTTIVRATPALFEPIILAPWFRNLMDASFGMASMDGSIDGVAF